MIESLAGEGAAECDNFGLAGGRADDGQGQARWQGFVEQGFERIGAAALDKVTLAGLGLLG